MKIYDPMYLSWAESYEEEVQEFKELIEAKPADVKLLRQELRNLKSRGNSYIEEED